MGAKVSIILPVYNGEKTLSLCLDSLMSLDFPKDDLEIVVVDNNSTDASREIVRFYPVKYVFESKRGRGAARNRGIKESKGELVAFIDADCVADSQWLRNIIKGFTDETIGGCGGEIFSYKPQTLLEKYHDSKSAYSQAKGILREGVLPPQISTSNAAYLRKTIEEVGLFDDSFIANEDVDLSWRVYFRGYKLSYIPQALVYHRYPSKLTVFFRKWFEHGYTCSYLLQKYINLIKMPLLSYDDWISFLLKVLQSIKTLFIKFFMVKDILSKIFSIFDIIKDTAFFLGRIYGLLVLKLGRVKILSYSLNLDNTFWQTVNNEMIITNPSKNCYYILNKIGSKIWILLREDKDIYEIINIISDEYGVNKEKVKNDLFDFITEFKMEGLMINDKLKYEMREK